MLVNLEQSFTYYIIKNEPAKFHKLTWFQWIAIILFHSHQNTALIIECLSLTLNLESYKKQLRHYYSLTHSLRNVAGVVVSTSARVTGTGCWRTGTQPGHSGLCTEAAVSQSVVQTVGPLAVGPLLAWAVSCIGWTLGFAEEFMSLWVVLSSLSALYHPSVADWGIVCLLAASAGPESRVRYAGYGRCLTCAVPGYYSQCRSVTTSTIVKRHWHVLCMLSVAIPSTWALAFSFFSFLSDGWRDWWWWSR